MLCDHKLEFRAGKFQNFFELRETAGLFKCFDELLGDNIDLARGKLCRNIAYIRAKADGEVSGKRPCRCCPDDEIGIIEIEHRELSLVVFQLKANIDGAAVVISVFYLGFSKRCFVVRAPIDRLFAPIDIALFIHCAENLDFFGFELGIHREIIVIPVAQAGHAHKLLSLYFYIFLRKLLAGAAELGGCHLLVADLLVLDYF